MIKSGRDGKIMYDPLGVTPVVMGDISKFKLSMKTDHLNVTCFGAKNKVYVPGLVDVSGSLSGFWNSGNLVLFRAATALVPGMLQLIPNNLEPTFLFEGLAYLDADIDTSVEGVPAVTGTFMAAGDWALKPIVP